MESYSKGDKIIVVRTGEIGVVTESLGIGCYMVRLEGWDEDCQVNGTMLDHITQIA